MTENAIELVGLTKRFGDLVAVDSLSFEVERGEIFGFMGHNGAGKTTTLRLLLGLTRPTSGAARVLGRDVVKETLDVRREAGFLPAEYSFAPDMTPLAFLHYVGAMFGMSDVLCELRAHKLLAQLGLTAVTDRKLGTFSSGMTQKVGIAQALINEPKVLFLDEPTSGLDPLGRHELLEILRNLCTDHGVTILFSSHILSDIETLCQRVAVVHRGRLVAHGDVAALKEANRVRSMDDLYLSLVRRQGAQ